MTQVQIPELKSGSPHIREANLVPGLAMPGGVSGSS